METKRKGAKRDFAVATSHLPRNARTFALQMAMDQAKREEVGERLRELRGARPQKVVAEAADVTLRAYQAWEAGDSGISWDHLEALADFHGVSTGYILDGPDVDISQDGSQLDRMEASLVALHDKLNLLLANREEPQDFIDHVGLERARAFLNSLAQLIEAEGAPAKTPRRARKPADQGARRATG